MERWMKIYFIEFLLLLILITPSLARDFQVEFIEENYRETQAEFSYQPLIYHSIQVSSDIGPKLLILKGDDYNYRKWLRHYISQDKKLIIKISDDHINNFISAQAYEIDVKAIHPVNGNRWTTDNLKPSDKIRLEGDNHILIVDPDKKKTIKNDKNLTKNAEIFNEPPAALELFKLQPEKFKMVVVYYDTMMMPSDQFVEQVVKLNPSIPVLLDTGYNNDESLSKLVKKFSGYHSIHIKSVILRDLQKTIETLIKKNV